VAYLGEVVASLAADPVLLAPVLLVIAVATAAAVLVWRFL
jgi:hypothetical protein